MNDRRKTQPWPWPGARWWKFDFHTHTPASLDTPWHRKNLKLSPEKWLIEFMTASIDCVAVTDHNSGAWIDSLKEAYSTLRENASDGFSELVIFPGVEISVQGGFHLLALLDPTGTTSDIDRLLGKVGYSETSGDSNGVTSHGAGEVIRDVLASGGLPIPAHADADKGLLAVEDGTCKSKLDANTVCDALNTDGLLAVEWIDMGKPLPECVKQQAGKLARVLGSDCHSFQGEHVPGSRYTWVKMAKPTLEGLRLALLDGNETSIRRSDDQGHFEPFATPSHFITAIEVESARFMGNRQPERLELSPYCNALIGGRGTGKSTIVHALRLAFRRDIDLQRLPENSDPRRQFEGFKKSVRGRDDDGALRENTHIRIELMCDEITHRLHWRADGQGDVVEIRDEAGNWVTSPSQKIHAERFPVRLFSQGQIATIAGESRQALLDVIDEAANIKPLYDLFEEAKRTWYTNRAKLRELDGRLREGPELQRKQAEFARKIEALAQSRHAEILKAHQKTQRQLRELEQTFRQLRTVPDQIKTLAQELLLDDWPDDVFDSISNRDVLLWRDDVEAALEQTCDALRVAAKTLRERIETLGKDDRLKTWRQRETQARKDYDKLQATLTAQGVNDPQIFSRLVQQRQQIDTQLKQLQHTESERNRLQDENDKQWYIIVQARKNISQTRADFLKKALDANEFVRIELVPYGFDAKVIEHELRELLNITGDSFEADILQLSDGEPARGLAFELATADNRIQHLLDSKQRLITSDASFGGHFRNHLERNLKKPEFADHVLTWFPTDDLKIKYSRSSNGKDWADIAQGSQGQRSAALLAFLLAFGNEPLVLDQPEDDLDNHLIYDLVVRQIRANKLRRQLIIVTHNPNIVVNGDAEMVHSFDFRAGQCQVVERGALQERSVRQEVCRVMEGGPEAFKRRWQRLGREA